MAVTATPCRPSAVGGRVLTGRGRGDGRTAPPLTGLALVDITQGTASTGAPEV